MNIKKIFTTYYQKDFGLILSYLLLYTIHNILKNIYTILYIGIYIYILKTCSTETGPDWALKKIKNARSDLSYQTSHILYDR